MLVDKKNIDELLLRGNILSLTMSDTTINARLVRDKQGEYKVALQNYGYFELDCLDYLINRNNVTVNIYNTIPESNFSPLINELITTLNNNLSRG